MTPTEIKNLRQSLKASRAEFAQMLCLSYRTIEAYELGARKPSKAIDRDLHEIKKQTEK